MNIPNDSGTRMFLPLLTINTAFFLKEKTDDYFRKSKKTEQNPMFCPVLFTFKPSCVF